MLRTIALIAALTTSAAAGQVTFTDRLDSGDDVDTFQFRQAAGEVNVRLLALDNFTPSVGLYSDDATSGRVLLNSRYGPGELYAFGPGGVYDLVVTGNRSGGYGLVVAAPAVNVPDPGKIGVMAFLVSAFGRRPRRVEGDER